MAGGSPGAGVRLRAGNLRHRVDLKLEPAGSTKDRYQRPTDSAATVQKNMPARVEPLAGRELEIARQVNARVTHRVTIRWASEWSDLSDRHYFVFKDSRNLYVEGVVNPEERNVMLQCMCREAA